VLMIKKERGLREKQIKEWRRKWKIELIEKANPEWKDLYYELIWIISDPIFIGWSEKVRFR